MKRTVTIPFEGTAKDFLSLESLQDFGPLTSKVRDTREMDGKKIRICISPRDGGRVYRTGVFTILVLADCGCCDICAVLFSKTMVTAQPRIHQCSKPPKGKFHSD